MSCNIKPNKIDYYLPETQEFDEFHVDQTVLIREEYLKKIPLVEYHEKQEDLSGDVDLYPYVNSYYNYTEDSDPLSKVNSLLAQPEILEKNIQNEANKPDFKYDTYSEKEAQIRYLQTEPVSFIILGKPNIGQEDLGGQLSNYWNCVYIEPQTLIEEEMESGSRAGECIEFNLRCGRAIGVDIILKLVEKRIKSESAQHRGFVICGFPLIFNKLYEEDPVSSQSAIFTARDMFEELFETVADICIAPSNPQVSASSKYQSDVEKSSDDTLTNITNKEHTGKQSSQQDVNIGQDYEKQLSFLFDFLSSPFFIIYVQCGSMDVLNKRDGYRFDVRSNQMLDTQRRTYNKKFQKRLIDEADVENLEEIYDPNFLDIADFRLKYLVQLPCDFKANVSSQLDGFHYTALRFIQNRVVAHNPEYYIKVDGRFSITKMLEIVKAKLRIMNLQQVLLPRKMTSSDLDPYFQTEETLLAEDPDPEATQNNEKNLKPEEAFRQLQKSQVPNRNFLWTWSEWEANCPVSLKAGFIKKGSVNFSVQFMNKIFFLADYDAFIKFCENPRPFLVPPFPRPTCKIFIFGPKLSGRTALAHCLAYYLNGTVLSATEMMKDFMHQRQDEYLEKLKQQAIAEGIGLLNKQRMIEAEEEERNRIEHIKEWVKTILELLGQMNNILEEIEKEEKKEAFEISSFPMAMKKVQTMDVLEDSEYAEALSKLRTQINDLHVPIYKLDIPTWKSFFTDRKKLLQYLPAELSQKTRPKPATVFDDFVKEYVENVLAQAGMDNLQISGGSISEMFITHMKIVEERYAAQGYGQGGWIVDGMLCNVEVIKDFAPNFLGDEIIVLQDDSKFLVNRYQKRGTTFFRDFRNFFQSMGLHDAALRSPSLTSTQKGKESFIQNLLDNILDSDDFYKSPQGTDEVPLVERRVDEYNAEIKTFQKEWSKVKEFYQSKDITPTEIKVSNKTLPELFKEVIKSVDSKYKYKAQQLSENNLVDEATDVEQETSSREDATTVEQTKSEEVGEKIIKYGDTHHFCPVTFHENFVLWRGKKEFAVTFIDKVYLLSTEYDMKKFLDSPYSFLPLSYPDTFPPPRICVIGVSGSGKSYLSKLISDNYGLIYLSYETFLKNCFKINTKETLAEMRNKNSGPLKDYLNGAKPLPPSILDNIKKFWFEEPFKSQGFVFDDFPKNHYDIDFIVKNKLIPDAILYPEADETYLKIKFLDKYLRSFHDSREKQRQENELKYSKALEKWREQRTVRFNVLMEEKREKRYSQKLQERTKDSLSEEAAEMKSLSQVTFDSVAEQEDVDEINKILDAELPPLVFDTPTESSQIYISKTEPIVLNSLQTDQEIIKRLKEKCLPEQIAFTEIPLNLDDFSKTKIASFLVVEPIKFRNRSFFESCYDVSTEVADRLLSSGYFFLSKFGKTCPVQYYENINPIQMYQVAEQSYDIFPVIHRSFIYFVMGSQQKEKFREDPLKYIHREFRFPIVPFRVAVIGPPKCGKTTLASRIERKFGFKLITRGQAARFVLKYLSESDLSRNVECVLRNGWELTDEMVIRCVEAAAFDKKAITQGIVFDGFPNTLHEVRHLSFIDLLPNIVVDLQATDDQILECLSNNKSKDFRPNYGKGFMRHLCEEWEKEASEFRFWYDREYQTSIKIPIDTCTWSVWNQSKKYLESTFWEIKHYHIHIAADWPLRLGNMLVTPLEFLERQSSFKAYCPVCLHFSNSLVSGGDPPDRTGLVQFRNFFYWICDSHIELFLKSPEVYLPPYIQHGIPANLPKRCSFNEMPENVYENGSCAVCYKNKRIITKGVLELAAMYNEKAYLFDSLECLNVFLRNPQLFLFEIEFRAPVYPELKYDELPVLGMLEQYVAKYIVKAVSFVAKRRPIIPGLSISSSALVGLGLFIKLKNEMLSAQLKPYYEEGFRLYNERRDKLLAYLDVMKMYRNPYLHYEEPLPDFRLPPASEKSQSLTTMVSRIVDECVDNIDLYLDEVPSDEVVVD